MTHKIKFMICGKEYILQSLDPPNHVYELARVLEERIEEYKQEFELSTHDAAIMVALHALDDVEKEKQHSEDIYAEVMHYVEEAGLARIEHDSALKTINALHSEIAKLKGQLQNRKL